MEQKTRILHLEDVTADAELVARELKKGGIDSEILLVDTKAEFEDALKTFSPDIILSDHSLASFNSHEALSLVKEAGIMAPFILVTATMSDEFAAKVMKEGADDYILKDRLHRLPSAVVNSIGKQQLQEQQRIIHEKLVFHSENTPLGFIEFDQQMHLMSISNKAKEIFKWELDEHVSRDLNVYSVIYEEDWEWLNIVLNQLIAGESARNILRIRNLTKDGEIIWCEWFISVMKNENEVTFMTLIQDITEGKKAEIERIKLVSDLSARNTELEQFAYIISHNLRAPVANIIGASSALEYPDLSAEEKEELCKGIGGAVKKLDEIVTDLNHILQAKNKMAEAKETVNFSELVNDIMASIINQLFDADVEIKFDFNAVNEFLTPKPYLYSIFFNLISNSVKYRRKNIHCIIEIQSRMENDHIELRFTDNGMGINLQKNGEQVFGLYKRFHTNIEGKGMGLFMVKTQVETLGGKISIKSEENKGTEFLIELEK